MSKDQATEPAASGNPAVRILSKTRRQCRWMFTASEREDLAKRQAEANQRVLTLEEDKKRIMAQFKADTEAAAGQRDELGRKVISGYEFRDLPCTCYADTPEPGKKSWVRDDTLEVVSVDYMTGADLQQVLPFEGETPDLREFENERFEDVDRD